MRLRGSGVLDGSLGGRRGVRGGSRGGACFETGPAACQTARSCRFGGGFDSRRARRLARRLARGASADGSRRAQRLARRLARGASADGSVDEPGVLPGGSLAALRRMVRSRRTRCLARRLARQQPRWAWAQAQSYSSWSVLTIGRLMPAPRISLNEVITGPSEVEGLSGSTARPFYLSA